MEEREDETTAAGAQTVGIIQGAAGSNEGEGNAQPQQNADSHLDALVAGHFGHVLLSVGAVEPVVSRLVGLVLPRTILEWTFDGLFVCTSVAAALLHLGINTIQRIVLLIGRAAGQNGSTKPKFELDKEISLSSLA